MTTPGMEGTFCATTRVEDSPAALRRLTSDRILDGSSAVVMMGSVLYAGYEGWSGVPSCPTVDRHRTPGNDCSPVASNCGSDLSRLPGRAAPEPT